MRSISSLLAVLMVLGLAQAASADADSLSDYFGPRELSVGESTRASPSGAAAIALNPAGLSLTRQLVFEGSYGFRPEDDARSIAVSACDSTVPVPGCYYYNYFSAEPIVGDMKLSRRAHQFGWAASRALTPRISIGTNTKYFDYNTNLMDEEDASGFAFDAGVVLQAASSINLAFVGYNLLAKSSPQYPLAIGTGVSVQPIALLKLSADAVWDLDRDEGDKTGRYGGGAELLVTSSSKSTAYPLRGGLVHDVALDTTFATAGIGFVNAKMGIDIGARKELGGEEALMVLGSLRLFGPAVK